MWAYIAHLNNVNLSSISNQPCLVWAIPQLNAGVWNWSWYIFLLSISVWTDIPCIELSIHPFSCPVFRPVHIRCKQIQNERQLKQGMTTIYGFNFLVLYLYEQLSPTLSISKSSVEFYFGGGWGWAGPSSASHLEGHVKLRSGPQHRGGGTSTIIRAYKHPLLTRLLQSQRKGHEKDETQRTIIILFDGAFSCIEDCLDTRLNNFPSCPEWGLIIPVLSCPSTAMAHTGSRG